MADNLKKIIQKADNLIKEEDYAEAWNLLLPYKDDENARKRLQWLKAKQQQLKLENDIAISEEKTAFNTWAWFWKLGWKAKLVFVAVNFCIINFLCYQFQVTFGLTPDPTERAQTEVSNTRATTRAENPEESPRNDEPTADIEEIDSPTPESIEVFIADEPGISFEYEDVVFVVQSVQFQTNPENYSLINAAALVLLGYVQNNDEERKCVSGNDVRLILDNQEYWPMGSLMGSIQDDLSPYRDYLGTFTGQCVDPDSQAQTFVAYDVPLSAQLIRLRFGADEKNIEFGWTAVNRSAGLDVSVSDLYATSTAQRGTSVAAQSTDAAQATQTATHWTITPSPTITPTASITPSPTITTTPAPKPTDAPALPMATYALYNPGDLCPIGDIEGRILQALSETEGVDFVQSLCLQTISGNVYFSADVIVYPGHNTIEIPQMLYGMVDETLSGNFETLINMSDGLSATAYSWFTDGRSSVVPYTSGVIPPTPRPRFEQSNSSQPIQGQVAAPIATAVPVQNTLLLGTTYYANLGDVKVRSCAQISCEQLTVLQFGEAISVIGETTGDSAYNSTRWFEVNWNGRRAYVHSQLLSSQRPVPTSPSVPNSSSGQNPPPVSQQQWNCSIDYNCGDFGNSCEQVMSYWNACPNDPSGLDDAPGPDGDGHPCESICGG